MQRCGIVSISEERDWWVKGSFHSGPVFEICFELWNQVPRAAWIAPETMVTAMDVWHGKETLVSFLFGRWITTPPDHFVPELSTLFLSLKRCYPAMKEQPVNIDAIMRAAQRGYAGTSGGREL